MELSCLQSSGVSQTVGGLQSTPQPLVSSQQHFRSKLADSLLEAADAVFGNDTMQTEKQAEGSTALDYATLKPERGGAGVTAI